MLKEFKAFAMRGNVLDLAVGIVIGAAFGKIVSSFVDDMLMPLVGMLLGKTDMKNLFIDLSGAHHATIAEAKAAGAATLNYGMFLNTIVDFLLVALAVFLLVKQVNKMMPPPPAPAAPRTRVCPFCITAIPEAASKCPACTSALPALAAG